MAQSDDSKPTAPPVLPDGDIPVHVADNLTDGGPVAQIVMDGQVYTLRITRQRKLILTK